MNAPAPHRHVPTLTEVLDLAPTPEFELLLPEGSAPAAPADAPAPAFAAEPEPVADAPLPRPDAALPPLPTELRAMLEDQLRRTLTDLVARHLEEWVQGAADALLPELERRLDLAARNAPRD